MYKVLVVGTDGSDSSLRAVERAGTIAAESDARLIIATAYLPQREDPREADLLKDEGYLVSGNAPVYAILRAARDRAKAVGAKDTEERAIIGAPVEALVELGEDVGADLLVVGNVVGQPRRSRVGFGAYGYFPPGQDRCAYRAHHRLIVKPRTDIARRSPQRRAASHPPSHRYQKRRRHLSVNPNQAWWDRPAIGAATQSSLIFAGQDWVASGRPVRG